MISSAEQRFDYIFGSQDEARKAMETAQSKVGQFIEQYGSENKISELKPKQVLLMLAEYERLQAELARPAYYGYLLNTIADKAGFAGEMDKAASEARNRLAWVEHEIAQRTDIDALMKQEPGLEVYRPWMEETKSRLALRLEPEAEARAQRYILENKGITREYNLFTRNHPVQKDVNLYDARTKLRFDADRRKRAEGWEITRDYQKSHSGEFASMMDRSTGNYLRYMALKGYDSPVAEALAVSGFGKDRFDAVMQYALSALPLLHTFHEAKAKFLGIKNTPARIDIASPLFRNSEPAYTEQEAGTAIIAAAGAISPEIERRTVQLLRGEVLRTSSAKPVGRYTAVMSDFKRIAHSLSGISGPYMLIGKDGNQQPGGEVKFGSASHPAMLPVFAESSIYGPDESYKNTSPHVLMRFTGNRKDIPKLAHEVCHQLHVSYGLEKGQLANRIPSFISESAAQFMETKTHEVLTLGLRDPYAGRLAEVEHMLGSVIQPALYTQFELALYRQKMKQVYLRCKTIEAFTDWVYDGEVPQIVTKQERNNIQACFDRCKQAAEAPDLAKYHSDSLDAKTISALYKEKVQDPLFSPNGQEYVKTDRRDAYDWVTLVPYFSEYPGYLFSYPVGELVAQALLRCQMENPETFGAFFESLLSARSEKEYERAFKDMGINLKDGSCWEKGVETFTKEVEAMSHALKDMSMSFREKHASEPIRSSGKRHTR